MIKSLLSAFLFSCFFSVSAMAASADVVADSVGFERRGGKAFVVHKVEPKETLYAISRKYGVPVAQIVEANPKVESTITIGQLIYIPRKNVKVAQAPAKPLPTAANRTYTVDNTGNKMHTVAAGQTLYAISKMHKVGVEDIKKWNNLGTNSIEVGQQLIVGKSTTPTKAPIYVPEKDDEVEIAKSTTPVKPVPAPVKKETPKTEPKSETKPETKAETAGEEVAAQPKDEPAAAKPAGERIVYEKESESIGKVTETGMAEMIDQRQDSNKYLALHRTAPVGSILQVKNIMNGQVVYVRVIGKLPSTGDNDKVLVKISRKAYQKLAALDNRFRVEVSYMP